MIEFCGKQSQYPCQDEPSADGGLDIRHSFQEDFAGPRKRFRRTHRLLHGLPMYGEGGLFTPTGCFLLQPVASVVNVS
jgi:hypothetical protein